LPLTVGLWDLSFVDVVAAALERIGLGAKIVREKPESCARMLVQGEVDVALVPTVSALLNADHFDVFPAFAVASWNYPYARLVLPRGLESLSSELAVPADASQEAFVAGVVLQEHYGTRVISVPVHESLPAADVNRLEVGEPGKSFRVNSIDLGREWFELSNYPMVWGLFASRRDNADPAVVRRFVDAAAVAENIRTEMAGGFCEPVAGFVADDLRFRMDDLATASLTELAEYVFYYAGTDEPPALSFVSVAGASADGSEDDETPLV